MRFMSLRQAAEDRVLWLETLTDRPYSTVVRVPGRLVSQRSFLHRPPPVSPSPGQKPPHFPLSRLQAGLRGGRT